MKLSGRTMRALGRLVSGVFFRRVVVEGADRFPDKAPVIVIANHPNSLIDGVLLISHLPRYARMVGASTIFAYRPIVPFLRAAGVIPIYRRKDVGSIEGRNVGAFDAAVAELEQNGVLAIFPEGVSHNQERLLPLKHGAARIAAEALRNGGSDGLRIVPVGLCYANKSQFQSDVSINIGAPVDPLEFIDPMPESGPYRIKPLTDALQSALDHVVDHPDQDQPRPKDGPQGIAGRAISAATLGLAVLPNGIPWVLSRKIAKGRDEDKRATWSLFASLFLFPIGWMVFALLVSALVPLDGATTIVFLLGLLAGPLTGYLAIPAMGRRVQRQRDAQA